MREAHAHIFEYGESIGMPGLSACGSVEECLAAVRREAASVGPSRWLRFHAARIEGWSTARWPTLAELDDAARDGAGSAVPCVIMSFDHHAAAANSAALRAAGMKAGERVGPQGVVCVDPATGHPTGLLMEHAAYRVWESAPAPTARERRERVLLALRALAQLGFSEVHDMHSQPWLGPTLAEIERAGELPVSRVRLYPAISELARAHADRSAWQSRAVRLAGGKVFADGTLNSRTALMLRPYREPLDAVSTCGRAMVTGEELGSALRLSESLGLHLAVHAIGDGAVRLVLDSIERVSGTRGDLGPGKRHRIEHCELIDAADIGRFARLGVVCSVQPCHLLADVEVLTRQLPDRLDRVLPLRELIDAGCGPDCSTDSDGGLLWFGSDVPIVRAEPEDSVLAAVQRRRAGLPPHAAIGASQSIAPGEAWAAFNRK